MTRLPAILAAALLAAACSTQPPPTGPGVAALRITGAHGECHSLGGCEYAAKLAGPGIAAEDTFTSVPAGQALVLGDAMPDQIPDGAYTLTFTSKLMSDMISNAEPRDFSIDATCSTPILVGPGRSTVHVRVTFVPQRCNIELVTTDS